VINENGRFAKPAQTYTSEAQKHKAVLAKRDEDLFQTARQVTCELYRNIILNDYSRTILNLQQTDPGCSAKSHSDLQDIFVQSDKTAASENQISAEFDLLSGWLSTVSTRDEESLKHHESSRDLDKTPNVRTSAGTIRHHALQPPVPWRRSFGELRRQPGGNFETADLVRILKEATEDTSASFGSHQIPISLKAVRVQSTQKARDIGIATLNEVRAHYGLDAHKSFSDINPDQDIATALELLYGDVANVELYPGAMIEEPKVSTYPELGTYAGLTSTRVISSELLSLVQGGRFPTVDSALFYLTAFGYNESSSDPSIAQGGVMYKLLMRVLRKCLLLHCDMADLFQLTGIVANRYTPCTHSQFRLEQKTSR
jgi:hypothetical protein